MSKRANGEGTVYKRRDGRWVAAAFLSDPATGRRIRRAFYGRTSREARLKREEALAAANSGLAPIESRMCFDSYLDEWVATHLPNSDRKASTVRQYTRVCDTYIRPELGPSPLSSITPLEVERFIGSLTTRGLSSSSRRAVFNVLSAAMSTAQRDGLIRRNPCSVVRRPRSDTTESPYLTVPQVQAAIGACDTNLRPLLTLMSLTGLRIGEVLALAWTDVDLATEALTVRHTVTKSSQGLALSPAKTKSSVRAVPLVPAATEALRRQRKLNARAQLAMGEAWNDLGLVFPTSIGTLQDYSNVLHRYQRAVKPLGIAGGFHVFRHSAATMLLNAGVPTMVVSQILGHARTSITLDVYGHVAAGEARTALETLSNVLGP